MKIGGWQTLCLVLLLGCLTSFAWAMGRFFLRPAGRTTGMWATALCGTAFAILHAGALLWPGSVTRGRGYFASAMYLSALSLFWWAIATNRRQPLSAIFSPDVPVHLMTAGPYRMVRHPFYCAYLLVWFAGLVATLMWWLVLSVAVMFVIYLRAARFEERKFLGSALARPYRDYQARTGQLLPNPWKMLIAQREGTDS
jgi:protein-S-isoprenylcysteine O-methyltransferase Ste14